MSENHPDPNVATRWATAAHIGKPEFVTHLYILVHYGGKGEILLDNIALLGGD